MSSKRAPAKSLPPIIILLIYCAERDHQASTSIKFPDNLQPKQSFRYPKACLVAGVPKSITKSTNHQRSSGATNSSSTYSLRATMGISIDFPHQPDYSMGQTHGATCKNRWERWLGTHTYLGLLVNNLCRRM